MHSDLIKSRKQSFMMNHVWLTQIILCAWQWDGWPWESKSATNSLYISSWLLVLEEHSVSSLLELKNSLNIQDFPKKRAQNWKTVQHNIVCFPKTYFFFPVEIPNFCLPSKLKLKLLFLWQVYTTLSTTAFKFEKITFRNCFA